MTGNDPWLRACKEAVGMSREARSALLQRLHADPDDLGLRVRLIGAFYLDDAPESQIRRAQQLAWLSATHPEVRLGGFALIDGAAFPEAYSLAKRAWQVTLAERELRPAALMNAAKFLHFVDPELAEPLYRRGAELEPDRAAWQHALGHLWQTLARTAESELDRLHAAEQALAAFDRARVREPSELGRFGVLIDMATAAAGAKLWPRADELARQVLAQAPAFAGSFQHGNALHQAHIVLGHAALARDDLASARVALVAAGKTPGSPQLATFGPDLQLAMALLARGERAAVSAYLKSCLRFWQGHTSQVRAWLRAIAEHENPFVA